MKINTLILPSVEALEALDYLTGVEEIGTVMISDGSENDVPYLDTDMIQQLTKEEDAKNMKYCDSTSPKNEFLKWFINTTYGDCNDAVKLEEKRCKTQSKLLKDDFDGDQFAAFATPFLRYDRKGRKPEKDSSGIKFGYMSVEDIDPLLRLLWEADNDSLLSDLHQSLLNLKEKFKKE